MTTRVLVSNFGPLQVEVRVQDAKAAEAGTSHYAATIQPGQHREFHVYDTQDLIIKERITHEPV